MDAVRTHVLLLWMPFAVQRDGCFGARFLGYFCFAVDLTGRQTVLAMRRELGRERYLPHPMFYTFGPTVRIGACDLD